MLRSAQRPPRDACAATFGSVGPRLGTGLSGDGRATSCDAFARARAPPSRPPRVTPSRAGARAQIHDAPDYVRTIAARPQKRNRAMDAHPRARTDARPRVPARARAPPFGERPRVCAARERAREGAGAQRCAPAAGGSGGPLALLAHTT
eukprot:gene17017-biopygen2098